MNPGRAVLPIIVRTATRRETSAAFRRVARSSRYVGQPDYILANSIIGHEAQRRPGSGEIRLAVTQHDGVQVDSILINQTKFSQAFHQLWASNFDLPVTLGLQLEDRPLKITLNKFGVGADRPSASQPHPADLRSNASRLATPVTSWP